MLLFALAAVASALTAPARRHASRRRTCLAAVEATRRAPAAADDWPLDFDRATFEKYLDRRPGLLARRAAAFAAEAGPLQLRAADLWARGQLRRDDAAFARSVRLALERLGPAFVKVGQLLSVREDILGPAWAKELALLQAGVQPIPGDAIPDLIRAAELEGGRVVDVRPEPAASASIAQVHRATWQGADGKLSEAAVKVVKPGVVERVAVDLCVLLRAAEVLETWAPRLLPKSEVDWRRLLEGLAAALWEEVDLRAEGRRQTRFRENMRSVAGVVVPQVLGSGRRVLVTEWVDGVPLAEVGDGDPNLAESVGRIRDAYCQSLYVDGYFHSDCHGGNLLWTKTDTLCILDCGLMVDISDADREGLLSLSLALAARDWPRVVRAATALGFLPGDLDAATRLKAEGIAARIVGPYLDVGGGARAASSYAASQLVRDVAAASASLPTALPPKMVLLGRAVVQLEGLALRADPDYKLVDDVLPVAARLALENGARDEGSLLYELLYDVAVDDGGFSPAKLRALVKSIRQTATGEAPAEVLDGAARDVVADETADALDALGRDLVWRLVGDRAPGFLKDRAEALVPRLSAEEEKVLKRLPDALAALDEQKADPTADDAPVIERVAAVPAVRDGAAEILRAAVQDDDAAAKQTLSRVADGLTDRLRDRLDDAGLPGFLAPRLPLPPGWRKR